MNDSPRNPPLPDDTPTRAGPVPADATVHLSTTDLRGGALGRYEIVREIGRGGMGVVFEARDARLERRVALKVLSAEAVDDAARERFLREARAAAALNHPNIVAIHDTGDAGGRPYLVMEYVPGGSLADQPPADLDEALAIARHVCDALEHAHARGLVHRDLKPGNILVTRGDGVLDVKLTDMGIALTRGAARVTRSGAFLGTPSFMAPEQALGGEVDARADLYSLGVMLYEWAAGRLPFEGDNALAVVSQHIHAPVVPPRTYRSDLPSGLESVILRLLAKDPALRFALASEVRQALAAVGAAERAEPAPPTVTIEALARGRLVGRRAELARLQELWTAVTKDGAHLALVSGEPGVGKTRLAHELMAGARLDGALVLTGGCYENEATTPYLPFLEAFRRVARERSREDLAAALGETAAEIARLAPEIETRLGPFPERASLPPHEERLRLFDAVARFLRRLGARRGLLFFLDDLQWADHGSLALLHYLLRQLGSDPVLFLGAYREVELDRTHALSKSLVDWNRERLATRVRLDRLSLEATGRMIRTLLGQEEVSQEFVSSLHRETEGNPFFVEEMVKALIAEGDIVREGTAWRRKTTGEFLLPQSVKAAIGSRLEQVSETCSEVLRTAAVLGKVFEFAELVSTAQRSEDELLDALDEASAAQIVEPRGGETFAFTHDKIREVLYDELNPIRRRRLHARIAEGLERMASDGTDIAVEELAHHFIESGDNEKGLVYAERAADAARAVFAWDEALAMLQRARECAEALEREADVNRFDETMGDVAHAQGDVRAAVAHFRQALAGRSETGPRNDLRAKCAEVCQIALDPAGRELAEQVLRETDPEREPGVAARAMMVVARYHHLDGELDDALALYRKAVALGEAGAGTTTLVRLYSYLAGTLQHRAEFEESDRWAERCVALGGERNAPEGTLLGLEFLAENSLCRGWWSRAVDYSRREAELAAQVHAGERLAWSYLHLYALQEMGRLAGLEERHAEAVEAAQRVGDRRLELLLRGPQAGFLALKGRLDEAAALVEPLVQEADEKRLSAHRILCRLWWVWVLMLQGRFQEATAQSRIGLSVWAERDSHGMGIQSAVLIEALVRAGEMEEARRALERHLELAERIGSAPRRAENVYVGALLAGREGRLEEATAMLGETIADFEETETRWGLVRALFSRATLLRTTGRASEAEADRARARRLAEECGALPDVLDLDAPTERPPRAGESR